MGSCTAIIQLLIALTVSTLAFGTPVVYWISPRVGSLAGGTTINVYGNRFLTDNYNSYNVILIGDIPCSVVEYNSSPRRLQCITGPYPSGEEGATYGALQITLIADGTLIATTGTHNQFAYNWSFTPQMRDIQPKSGPVSSLIELGGYRLTSNYMRYHSILLGDGICKARSEEDNTVYGPAYRNSLLYIKCQTTEKRTGGWNATMVLQGSSGRTWNHSQGLYPMHDWSLAMYEIYPDIHTVVPQVGSIKGGTLVTIIGTGFQVDITDDIAVDIGGIPCRVLWSSSTKIQCMTDAPPSDSAAIADHNMTYPATEHGYRFRGSRGVKYFRYSNIPSGSLSALHTNVKYPDQPDYRGVFPAFNTDPTRREEGDNYGARFIAFFNPHESGNHTFFITSDDEGGAWLAQGNNVTNANRIVTNPYAAGYNNFYERAEQKADTIYLDAGEDFLLVAEMKEGGGGDYLQVGVLMDETNFTHKDTQQAVQERQLIELYTAGLYEVQKLHISLNASEIEEASSLMFTLHWGSRGSDPFSLLEPDGLDLALTSVLSGVCEEAFGLELGFTHFDNIVYGFEEWTDPWTGWEDNWAPVQSSRESLCGRYSLFVENGRAKAPRPDPSEEGNGVRVSDYPYLCLAYNLPYSHRMVITIHLQDLGWYSIPLSSTQHSVYPNVASFWDYSDDEYVQDDYRWHFACTDLEEMLSDFSVFNQDSTEDFEDSVQSVFVDGLGFYSNGNTSENGFYVDEVSFASEKREFVNQYYVAPTWLNGYAIHNVSTELIRTNESGILNTTYLLTIIPATCQTSYLPLLNITLEGDRAGVLDLDVTRYQQASSPIQGNYTISFKAVTTSPLMHNASSSEIKAALESLEDVGKVTVGNPQPLTRDLLGGFCPGRRFEVQFEENSGNLPLVEINSQSLVGDELATTVEEIFTGGLFLRPIPGHMLQTAEVTPQVHVRIRGQLAACSGKHTPYEITPYSEFIDYCGFKYGQISTPLVISINPTTASGSDIITISGSGFSEVPAENFVLFGAIECAVVSSSLSSIECVLGSGFGGFKPLYLRVLYSGLAETNSLGLHFLLSISSISPSEGSQAGSTEVTIIGDGFHHLDGSGGSSLNTEALCSGGWRNEVLIGGVSCTVINSTARLLTILTPRQPSLSNHTYNVEVSILCPDNLTVSSSVVLQDAFFYNLNLTSIVLSITPSSGTVLGGETVAISGRGFSGFSRVFLGDSECAVTNSSDMLVTCVTPPHVQEEVQVSVVEAGIGKAAGIVTFTFEVQLATISHCSGSVFGGQIISIGGRGFGMDPDLIEVNLGEQYPCEVDALSDTEIVCVTSPISQTYHVNNNAYHSEYGLGYSWTPSSLNIVVGDTVEWNWTGSPFSRRIGVAQVNAPYDLSYCGNGFRSEQSITGSFTFTFTKPGTFYYITEGYAHIGFRGQINVREFEDVHVSLSISINSIPVDVSRYIIQCCQDNSEFHNYTYAVTSTPVLRSVSRQRVTTGDSVLLGLEGISVLQQNNFFVFGGNTNMTCSYTNPPVFSEVTTQPRRILPSNTSTYGNYSVECDVPDLSPGQYRPVLYVAGRGWGYASLQDTMVLVQPQITSAPVTSSGSLRGGLSLAIPTIGLSESDVVRTRVKIGNTPCQVQSIDNEGLLTCLTQPIRDDGYSSLLQRSSPLAYWSLQTDYHRYNGSYLASDGVRFFRSGGILGTQANASVHGMLSLRQPGISGNNVTDQSVMFTEAAYLQVPPLYEFINPFAFTLEFWMKVPRFSSQYRILINSSSLCDGVACGFLVLLNPCNQIEYWIGSGQPLVDDAVAIDDPDVDVLDSDDGIASGRTGFTSAERLMPYHFGMDGSGQFDETSGSGAESETDECDVIIDEARCSEICSGYLQVTEDALQSLPTGAWYVLRNAHTIMSDWSHVQVSWHATDVSHPMTHNCTLSHPCDGMQELVVNGDHSSLFSTYLGVNAGIELGGTSVIPLGTTGTWNGLSPFMGYLDEIAYYDRPLELPEINERLTHGLQDTQPIFLTVESFDGVGEGPISSVRYPKATPPLNVVSVDWEHVIEEAQIFHDAVFLKFEWTGSHGVRQVSRAVFESCDLEAGYLEQWSPNVRRSSVNIQLESGGSYYFIDSAVGGCSAGRKLSVQIGSIHEIDWRLGVTYKDLTITEGSGLLFRWSGSYHNLLEMSSPIDSDCKFVSDESFTIGQVQVGWLKNAASSGNVLVQALSAGEHYFTCSVGDHCQRGMRLTVRVEPELQPNLLEDTRDMSRTVHIVRWLIQDYQDMTVTEGDAVTFVWDGFHSLHQVSEGVYTTCDLNASPLYVWAEHSVDNRVTVERLTPGTYYFICSVAGHCSAGMRVKITVLPDDSPALLDPVAARCAENVSCYFSYSAGSAYTPQLLSVEPTSVYPGSTLTVRGVGLFPTGTAGRAIIDFVDIWLTNALCSEAFIVTSSEAEDVISCTIPNYESNYYDLNVHVQGKGYASLHPTSRMVHNPSQGYVSPHLQVFLRGVVNGISPSLGSVLGGSEVTIYGSGFSVSYARVTVRIGEFPCTTTASTLSEITCVTSLCPSENWDMPLDLYITVNGHPVSSALQFTYSTAVTPVVTTLSTQYATGGETITIMGFNFNSQPKVYIASTFSENQVEDECSIITSNDSEISCTLPFKPAGIYRVLTTVGRTGFAGSITDDATTVEYALSVADFSPRTGGYGGGLVLTVSGHGFPDHSLDSAYTDTGIVITVCDVACSVLSSSLSMLTCVLATTPLQGSLNYSTACNLTMDFNQMSVTVNGSFMFEANLTPHISSISPSIGGTAGGTIVTLVGSGFLPEGVTYSDELNVDDITVSIDGATCEWASQTVTDTEIVCHTSSHETTMLAQVEVYIRGKGHALNAGNAVVFEYIDLWSSVFTWGMENLPGPGESVHVRTGQTVLLDISPPLLNLLVIEGSLIFSDTQDLHLQAKYIFVNNGTLQIGTENSPFQHKATVTLHGNITDPEIPIYGAKVLGVRQGHLDLHGRPRDVTWTRLAETAAANATRIMLQQEVDWVTGDRIVLAPTGKNGNETEENEVESVSADGRTVDLSRPLNFTHHGITETLEDGSFIEIRAEVGLLSHNVIIQGFIEDQIADQYGVQIFVHRMGPHPTPIRIEHTEIRHSGQAFRLGRYSVHFHLSGSMNGSYVRHCSIHHSFNRAITAHGVHHLLIEGNVAYDIMGHTYFVEDGIETENRYLYNLGVLTRGSSSLLNTDQIPATFWITNPQNTFIGNAAAASRAYGFWYDLDNLPSGASFTRSVCPNKAPFGVFRNNTAHTCNEFGLRIWERYTPYADGCGGTIHEEATLYDFTTYGNGIHGVELSVVGHVRLSGFKVADNVANGIEIQETLGEWGGPRIMNSLIISHTSVNSGRAQTGGIKTPNTPLLTISNVTFGNFDLPSTSCLRACSHCKERQGGFEVDFEQLRFLGGSELHKTAFQWEFEVVYRDLDGSLTGLPGGGWVVPNSALLPSAQCSLSVPKFSNRLSQSNGTVCTAQVHFLRMAWNRALPQVTLMGVGVNVTNEFGSTVVPWRHYRLTHMDGYMFTMAQGYAYTISWLLPLTSRVDTTSYSAGVYGMAHDSRLWITHEFVTLPDHVNVGGQSAMIEHGDIPIASDDSFSWFIDNQTNTVTYLLSGANNATMEQDTVLYTYSYEPCPPTGCLPPGIDYGPYESRQRRWSDPNSWPSGTLPMQGDDVTISSRWRMLLDINPPRLANVYVYGELLFEDQQDYNFTADMILINGPNSRLIIGTEDSPFSHQVIITLMGRREDRPLKLPEGVILGSKAIGVFGNLSIHGTVRTCTWTRLQSNALASSITVQVPAGDVSGWRVGDQIVIAPSGYDPTENEIRTIANINGGVVTLSEPLAYDHEIHAFLDVGDLQQADHLSSSTGSDPWWGDGGTMAPEVGLLTHNIVIQGGEDFDQPLEEHHYGCRILVGQYIFSSYTFSGQLKMDSVEVRHCGQGGYFSPRDPRYSIAFRNSFETSVGSYIRRSSVHHGYNTAIGIHTSYGVEVSGNVIWRTTDSSVKVGGSRNMITNNLAMMTATVQPNRPPDNHAVDFPATFDVDFGNTVHSNAAAGSMRLGFQYAGESCLADNLPPTEQEAQFWGNTAHSGLIGLNVLGIPHPCTAVGGFTSAFQWNYGVFSSTASSLVVTHLKVATGKVGINLNIFGPDPVAHLRGHKFITISDSLIVGSLPGETCVTIAPDYRVRGGVSFAAVDHKIGIMMSSFNQRRSKMDGTGAWHLMKGYPVIDGVLKSNGISFARFNSNDGCSYGSYAIGNNPLSPDAVHPMHMSATNKYNVDLDSLAFFYEPDPAWIVQEDCVDMDCDGPKHALIRDIDGRFVATYPAEGSIVPIAELRFSNYSSRLPRTWLANEPSQLGIDQLVEGMGIAKGQANDLESVFGGCELRESWQAYRCKGLQHRMLVIESLDADTETRRLSPLALHGGDTGAGEYTDLLNGPMDHGWCTYYTCLKRLSTFFTIVAEGTDYCVWMTGSPPNTIRFHLLNARPQDSIRMCMWFKSSQRKDVYKNGVFIEPENVQYLSDGAVLQTSESCPERLDGTCIPARNRHGGANYFHRETQIMHMVIKGSDPIEIRTPPVVQVSLSLAVSLDNFFNIGELVHNIAFILKIDKSKIRVVEIVAEDSGQRSRRSLLTSTSLNHTSITIEFGDPPALNITTQSPPSVAEEIDLAREMNDSVDLQENAVPDYPLHDSNPLNEDPPETLEDFLSDLNVSAIGYIEEVAYYQQVLEELGETNMLVEQFINMVLTGDTENIINATVLGISVLPAQPVPPPQPPIVPPDFEDSVMNVLQPDKMIMVQDWPTDPSGEEIQFVFPSSLRVTMEPYAETGHLVHVQVSIFDEDDNIVVALGFVNPWLCEATLVSNSENSRSASTPGPSLGGETRVAFVNGVAEFTRLRVDRPGSNLTLQFSTNPTRFQTVTSIKFTVVAPPTNTPHKRLRFSVLGSVSGDLQAVQSSIRTGLASALDVDISRITDVTYAVTVESIAIKFNLLDRQPTDPPNVNGLDNTIILLQQEIRNGLTISINNHNYTAVRDSFEVVTTVQDIPPNLHPQYIIIIAIVGGVIAMVTAILLLLACFCCVKKCSGKGKASGKVSPSDHINKPHEIRVRPWSGLGWRRPPQRVMVSHLRPSGSMAEFPSDTEDGDCWMVPSPPHTSLVSLVSRDHIPPSTQPRQYQNTTDHPQTTLARMANPSGFDCLHSIPTPKHTTPSMESMSSPKAATDAPSQPKWVEPTPTRK